MRDEFTMLSAFICCSNHDKNASIPLVKYPCHDGRGGICVSLKSRAGLELRPIRYERCANSAMGGPEAPPSAVSPLPRPHCTRIDPVKLNISRPSADAPDSMAIYERLRELSADENADHSDEDILTEVVSALFNIVAKLESESGGS